MIFMHCSPSLAKKATKDETTILSILLLAAVTATSNAQRVWTVGLPGDGWAETFPNGGGPETAFTIEGGVNALPGEPDGDTDDDYYFAGVYNTALDDGDYEPWGEVFENKQTAERAIHTVDPSLRYHFNLPDDLGNEPLTVRWDSNVIDIFGGHPAEDARHDPADGDSFQVFVADTVNGTPTIATEGWTYDSTTGSVVFGALTACNPNTMGDIDGSGDVAFADFLILSANFGQAATDHTTGDIDCSGDVAFADFLILSQNFGQTVGGAESVPEPTSFALFSMAGLLGGLMRRRRQN